MENKRLHRHKSLRGTKRLRLDLIATLIGLVLSMLGSFLTLQSVSQRPYLEYTVEKDIMSLKLSDQIEIVTKTLENSSRYLDLIQTQLEERLKQANALKQEVEDAKSFLELSDSQVSAVKGLIGYEMEKNSRGEFWISFSMNFGFFILGVLATHFTPIVISKISNKWHLIFKKGR